MIFTLFFIKHFGSHIKTVTENACLLELYKVKDESKQVGIIVPLLFTL
jgi:hypothetical protein